MVGKCTRCGAEGRPIEKHHIKARIHDGADTKENLIELCRPCHRYMSSRLALELQLEGYHRQLSLDRQGGWRSLDAAKDYYKNQIIKYKERIKILDELNTPELIYTRGHHESYYGHEKNSWEG